MSKSKSRHDYEDEQDYIDCMRRKKRFKDNRQAKKFKATKKLEYIEKED
jgi:hypothetical protein